MELNERLLAEIAGLFRSVRYGRLIFYINPDAKMLDYTVEKKEKLPISIPDQCQNNTNISKNA